jgi:pilus assembly protein CpaB
MRWQFLGLLLIGVVAAVCAAVLVASLKTAPVTMQQVQAPAPQAPPEVEIVVATKALDRMTTIKEDMLKTAKVPAEAAPDGAYPSPVALIGKILVAPVVAGQPFTKSCFAASGPGVHLAATLPEGMRAMSVSLSDYSSMDGLLYPGCAVDVLASFDMRSKADDKEAGVISTTILRGVQVLAIEDKTAVSSSEKPEDRAVRSDRHRRVTLMVTPHQAEELQLAMEHGMISLAMRNPQDMKLVNSDDKDITSLKEMGPTPPPAPAQVIVEKPVYIERPAPVPPANGEAAKAEPRKIPPWQVQIFKGGERTDKSFPVQRPASESK